jgi:hypothetical protein
MSERIGGWIQTNQGVAFYPLDPRPEEILIIDIAKSLSMQCRYAGHCEEFYSVAEHCCLMHDAIEDEFKAQALMHDSSEAYLVDLPRPIKAMLPDYKAIEANLEKAIFAKFKIPYPFHPRVKEFDNRILMDEKEQNVTIGPDWGWSEEPLGVILRFWEPDEAMYQFMLRYHKTVAPLLK